MEPRTSRFGHHPIVSSHYWAGLALWFLGHADQAAERLRMAVLVANELAHSSTIAFAECRAARVFHFRREPGPTAAHARSAMETAEAHDLAYQYSLALPLLGWAKARSGDAEAGIESIVDGLDRQKALGARMDRPFGLSLLADALLVAGRPEEVLPIVEDAISSLGPHAPSFFWLAEFERLRARALHLTGRTAAAEVSGRAAVAVAERQEAPLLHLRARTDLVARLSPDDRAGPPLDALHALYATITEGFDTPDLKEAAALLGPGD